MTCGCSCSAVAGHIAETRSFDELVDGLRLSSPGGHEHDMAGLEDGADALRQAVLSERLSTFPPKNRALSRPGLAGQGLDPGSGGERGAGFVERDMPVGADPKNLEVHTAGIRYGSFVRLARARQIRQPARPAQTPELDRCRPCRQTQLG